MLSCRLPAPARLLPLIVAACLMGCNDAPEHAAQGPDNGAPGDVERRPPEVAPKAPLPPLATIVYNRPFVTATERWVGLPTATVPPTVGTGLTAPPAGQTTRLLELSGDDGTLFLVTEALGGGAFGTFHHAADRAGHAWAVKRLVMPGSAAGAGPADAYVMPSSEEAIRRELGLLSQVGGDFDIKAVLQTPAAVYVVMTLMDGDVAQLLSRVPDKQPVLRALLTQIGRDAEALHALGFVHNDLRIHNFLWNKDGRLRLADFGLATRVAADGYLERASFTLNSARGLGTPVNDLYVAPEVLAGRYDYKADTWSFGLTLVEALLPEAWMRDGLFELSRDHAGFRAWQTSLRDPAGALHLARIVNPEDVAVPLHHWYFHAMFNAVKRVDPALCGLILDRMLVHDPEARASMGDIATAAAALRPAGDDVAVLLQNAAALDTERTTQLQELQRWAQTSTTLPTVGEPDPLAPLRAFLDMLEAARQQGAAAPASPH